MKPGRVVAELMIPNHHVPYYIIELDNTYEPHLQIRDALLMSDSPDKALPFSQVAVPNVDLLHSLVAQIEVEEDGTGVDQDDSSYEDFDDDDLPRQ